MHVLLSSAEYPIYTTRCCIGYSTQQYGALLGVARAKLAYPTLLQYLCTCTGVAVTALNRPTPRIESRARGVPHPLSHLSCLRRFDHWQCSVTPDLGVRVHYTRNAKRAMPQSAMPKRIQKQQQCHQHSRNNSWRCCM